MAFLHILRVNNFFEVDMRIHRVKAGEGISDIAKEYGVCEAILRKSNEIHEGDRLSEGEELLVLMPTRTYTAGANDSLSRVAIRFDVPRGELMRMNPHLVSDEIGAGEVIAVKRDARPCGMGAANGVYYRGCPRWKLMRALPYTTYLTVGSGVFDGERCYEGFDGGEAVEIALEHGKLPLVRVYDKSDGGFSKTAERRRDFIDQVIYTALKGGYRGIDLGGCKFGEGYEEFLVELRGRMIGLDLILISEISADSPCYASDFSDGAILGIDRIGDPLAEEMSFTEYEKGAMEKFANRCEGTKTFMEIPTFGCTDRGEFIDVAEAIAAARKQGALTEIDESKMILSFADKKRGRIAYNSLSGIVERFKLLGELGYMGVSFDIGRCPISYLLAYDSLFKSVGYANVEKRVRCNPDSSEINI